MVDHIRLLKLHASTPFVESGPAIAVSGE
jgi:hypothetical protein